MAILSQIGNLIYLTFAFAIILGPLVFFHELGHFLAARLCGVGVEKFSLGFGPRIFGKKIGLTDYRISAIPLGGYVKMVGEEPDAEIDPEDIPISFTHKHVLKRMLIVSAGPLFNILLAVIIFYGMIQIYGIPKASIGNVLENSPAETAGIQKGDLIVSIDGTSIRAWDDMAQMIHASQGRSLDISARRGESLFVAKIQPKSEPIRNNKEEVIGHRYMIGVGSSGEALSLNPFEALFESIKQTYMIEKEMIRALIKMFRGDISLRENLGGPIAIAQMSGQVVKRGLTEAIFLIALLSINLGILNFFPIPVLDGGHLVFFFVELIIGRPVNTRMREIAQQVGIFVLIMLMVFVFYNDISRVFSS